VTSQRGIKEVTDLTTWEGRPGLYIMVLDDYCQAFIGASSQVLKRIRQRWSGAKELDRLVFGDVNSSRSTTSELWTPPAYSQ